MVTKPKANKSKRNNKDRKNKERMIIRKRKIEAPAIQF